MVVNESMYQLGSVRSAIRELFEYGKKRAAIVGKENVYDFSIGNPSIPAPQIVNDTIKELVTDYDSVALHGYTSAQGDVETRAAIAEFLNNTHGTHFNADNLYMTMGAAASLSVCFRALTSDAYDEFITIAPYFPEYKVFVNAAGARLVEVPADTEHFQIDFEALEERINAHTRGVIINSPNNPSGTVYSEGEAQNIISGKLKFSDVGKLVIGTLQFQTVPSLTEGATAQDWGAHYLGALDQFHFYNKALKRSEIRNLYVTKD